MASSELTASREPERALDIAREALRACDPVLRGLIDANPDLDFNTWREALPVEGLFEALLYQIVGQQISVSAANAIHARLAPCSPVPAPPRRASRRSQATCCAGSAFRPAKPSMPKT